LRAGSLLWYLFIAAVLATAPTARDESVRGGVRPIQKQHAFVAACLCMITKYICSIL
jgi:hypothetical protein